MEEHIFGTYATDELKITHHRAMRQGIQHRHQLDPRDPLPGQPVTLTVRLGPELDADGMACYYTTDGSRPEGRHGQAHNGAAVPLHRVDVRWDSLAWDYLAIWQGTLPAQPEGTQVRYRIGAWAEDGAETFADWPDAQLYVDKASEAFFHDRPLPENFMPGDPAAGTLFTYRVDRAAPPAWARDMVMYEVFVDRFYPGDGRRWTQTANVSGFCGGTLQGVADKLEYITGLGCNALWLTPIFPSPTHHGYDATDYTRIEPRLGGDAGLRLLVDEAHKRGVRVVLDLVCNHVSNEHPVFLDALKNPASPYRDWFTFDDSTAGYRAFFGVKQMPQLNLAQPAARDWMLEIARYWLREFDVDGYRLDYGNGPGPDFWVDFSAACKAVKPDCFCFGEIVEAPDVIRTYAGRLDGNLDFHVETALRRAFAYDAWPEERFERFLARHYAYFPSDFVMPTFLDNHDTDRFLFVAGGDKERLKRAAAAQMKLPAPPIIYYGTEVGLSQTRSKRGLGLEVSRAVMPWGKDQDAALLDFYKASIQQRQAARRASLASD